MSDFTFTITCTFTESELPLSNTDFHSWDEVNWALQRIAARAPQGGAYSKTCFTVRHNPTGQERSVRVDVHNLDYAPAPRLRETIVDECEWVLSEEGQGFLTHMDADADAARKQLRFATFWREALA